jgi:hypothetical protein
VQRSIHYDEGAKGLLLLLLIAQLFLTNGIYLFVGACIFAMILLQLQQPYKPSVFTVIFVYHFIQVAAGIWLSNFLGKDINYRSSYSATAVVVGYIGLVVLFAPIIIYQNKIPAVSLQTLKNHADRLSIDKVFKAYVIGFFAINAMEGAAFLFSGLTQIVFSLVKIKWFLFLLFGLLVFLKKKKQKEFWFFAAFEFVSGFYSYFSEFKTVLFFLFFLFLFFLKTVNIRQLIFSMVAGLAVFFGMAFYQGIKGDYRLYLNQGSKSQTVAVSKDDALGKLVDLAQAQKEGTMSGSIESFLDRFQYTYHLAKTMEIVPKRIPYQNGANWGTSLEFSLTPRLLNPNKPIYEASSKATKYTGIGYAGAKQGVSVSLGYFADGYIDFGIIGMFLPILILGFVMGSTYFYFVRKSSNNYLFNFAVVGAMYMEFFAFEMDSTFLAGRLFATLLTFIMLKIFFFPWLYNQLSAVPVKTEVETRDERDAEFSAQENRDAG